MKPPENATVFETTNGQYWFEGDILYVITRKGQQLDIQTAKKETEEFKKTIGNRPVCAIMDVSHTTSTSKEVREYNAQQLTHLFKAVAFIITNPVSRMVAHLYIALMPLPFPAKMFSDEKEAYEWIKQYCKSYTI